MSQTSQQPFPLPELQVSPVGRQSVFVGSIWHCPPTQMFEQHSAFAAQADDSILQTSPPQTPPLQLSSQQSSALAHAVPGARQKGRHLTRPVPVSGSQRPLQQSDAAVHSTPDAWQSPPSMHWPSMQKWEQQSSGFAQDCPDGVHVAPPVEALVTPSVDANVPAVESAPLVAAAPPAAEVVPSAPHAVSAMNSALRKNASRMSSLTATGCRGLARFPQKAEPLATRSKVALRSDAAKFRAATP